MHLAKQMADNKHTKKNRTTGLLGRLSLEGIDFRKLLTYPTLPAM